MSSINASINWVRKLQFYPDLLTRLHQRDKISEVAEWMDIFPPSCYPNGRKLAIQQIAVHLSIFVAHAPEVNGLYPPTILRNMLEEYYELDAQNAHKLLAGIQFERLLVDLKEEKESGRTTNKTNQSVKILNQILVDINKLEIDKNTKRITKTKVIVGNQDNNDSKAIYIDQQVSQQYRERWGQATQKLATDPEARRRFLHLLEKARAQVTPGVELAVQEAEKIKETEHGQDP